MALGRLFEEFVLKIPAEQSVRILEPILETIDRHPRETSSVLQGIIGAEDRLQQTDRFWSVWRMFGQRVRQAKWLANIDNEHALGTDVMAAVFLTQYWKDDVEHWRSLEGHSQYVHELFEDLPPSSSVLDNYVRFIYHIGSQSLPRAFQIIAGRLRAGAAGAMLRQGNTVFMLESLLRRYVYGRPRVLKRNGDLREAVLYLLDTLVENGSSSAYRMRDDFVTPAAATA